MNNQEVGYKAKAFEARNLAIFFLISTVYPLLLTLLSSHRVIPDFSEMTARNAVFVILLYLPAVLGPTAAAFVLTGLVEGKPGVKALWRRFWNRSLSFKWLLVVILCLPLLRLIAGSLTQVLVHPPWPLLAEGGVSALLNGVLLGLLSGLREEFGWRGYVLPRLQVRWNALTSSIILGVITGLWHLPAFFRPGEPLFGANMLSWCTWHLLLQVVGYTWIYNSTRGSILALVLFHATTSIGIFNLNVWIYIGVMLVAAILIVAVFGPRNLAREELEEAIAREQAGVPAD